MRNVLLGATWHELYGDETFELWLRHGTGAWALVEEGDVTVGDEEEQQFTLTGLVEGDHYTAQTRLKRNGRYRVGYLTADPDTWPAQSRVDFVAAALEDVEAPTIDSAVWSRTSALATQIALSVTAADTAKGLRLFRNGVQVAEIPGPHVNPVAIIDDEAPLGELHEYVARHFVESTNGTASAPVECFGGPAPPADFVRTTPDSSYHQYTLTWDADGDDVEPQDDFLCVDTAFQDTAPGDGRITDSTITVFKSLILTPPGATASVSFTARARRYKTTFGVEDVSNWVEVPVTILIDDDNNEGYNTCP